MKTVIVINGKGKAGKSYLCECLGKKYRVREISSVDRVKEAARCLGWDGEKDSKGRAFLHDIKMLSVNYNNYLMQDLIRRAMNFHNKFERNEFLVINIREPEEIRKFIDAYSMIFTDHVYTLLIKRAEVDAKKYGNEADDGVEGMRYDMVYHNDKPVEEAAEDFIAFIENHIEPAE